MQESKNVTLTSADINFLRFNINEHIELLKEHHGAPYEDSIPAEKKRGDSVFRKVISARNTKGKINRDDLLFIEFVLEERGDFIAEGIGRLSEPNYPHSIEAARCVRLIKKLKRWCGIREDEDDYDSESVVTATQKVSASQPKPQTQPSSLWDWKAKFEQISFF